VADGSISWQRGGEVEKAMRDCGWHGELATFGASTGGGGGTGGFDGW